MMTGTMSDMMDRGDIETADVFRKFAEVGSRSGQEESRYPCCDSLIIERRT